MGVKEIFENVDLPEEAFGEVLDAGCKWYNHLITEVTNKGGDVTEDTLRMYRLAQALRDDWHAHAAKARKQAELIAELQAVCEKHGFSMAEFLNKD